MAKIKDRLAIIKDKFKTDKPDDQNLKLPYDINLPLNNIIATKEFCSEIKRIGSHGIVTYSIEDDDRKKKNKSLCSLSQLFDVTSSKFQEYDPMRGPLYFSAKVLSKINGVTMEFERNVQQQVIVPLTEIETQCLEIQELRKKLHDLRRDIESITDKYGKMKDQANSDDQKCHLLKDELEEILTENDNVSDLFLQKILQFEASNFEHASAIHEMIILRAEYHDKCSKELMKMIPEANQYMEDRRHPISFGYPLENHLREIKKCIAYPIDKCVTYLLNNKGLEEEGLFRVSGGKVKSNLLCSVLNLMKFDEVHCSWSPHVIADALKRYLRELPVPLLGKVTFPDWDSCHEKFKNGKKQEAFWQIKELLNKMPKSYYNNVEYLIRFLNKVVVEKSSNLMNVQNICTVFSPNLFKQSNTVNTSVGMNMEINTVCNFILESLLNDANFYFPHSNQKALPPLPESSIMSINRSLKEPGREKNNILYRINSAGHPTFNEDRPGIEIKYQRRRQRCLDSHIFVADDQSPPQISPRIGPSSTFWEPDLAGDVPIPPLRRNKKL